MKTFDIRSIDGIGPTLYERVRREFLNDEWRREPYLLCDVRGMGFKRADAVAKALGVSGRSPERVNAAAQHVLKEAEQGGNTCLPVETFGTALSQTLEISLPTSIEFDDRLHEDGGLISRASTTRAESAVAAQVSSMMRRQACWVPIPKHGLRNDQRDACKEIENQHAFALLGGPGTGKTWLVERIASAAGKVELCAPTGKAAKRIEELSGFEARTIHRMLGTLHEASPDYHSAPAAHSHRFRFRHNHRHPLDCDLVICDEASMLDVRLAADLCEALPSHARLLLVGDPFQLPSVGAGAVLRDLTSGEGSVPNVELMELKRQNPDLLIARNCKSIRFDRRVLVDNQSALDFYFMGSDSPIETQKIVVEFATQRIPEKYGFAPAQVMVLAPLREKGDLSVKALNIALRKVLNPDAAHMAMPWVGDRVIQRSNDYDLDIMNGDTGTIIAAEGNELIILFDTPEREVRASRIDFDIDLAYALTVHKSQGSEWPAVIVVIDGSGPAQYLADAQLTYTAISRAREVCMCIGSRRALDAQAARHRAVNRYTRLGKMMRDANGAEI